MVAVVESGAPPTTRAALPIPEGFWRDVQASIAPGPWPPPSEPAADAFVGACQRHGLLPLLSGETRLPDVVGGALGRHRALQSLALARAALFERAVADLRRRLAGERYAFLKGVDYARRLYGSLHLRPMQDVDVLVPASDFEAVCARLAGEGLRPVFPGSAATRAPGYFERAFLMGDMMVEIHQALIQPARYPVDYAALWSRVRPVPGSAGERALDDVDALAHQALSLAVDHLRIRMIRALDLWLLCGSRERVREARERAASWGAARAFYAAFAFLSRELPFFAAAGYGEIAAEGLSPRIRGRLDTRHIPRWLGFETPRDPRWRELRFKLAILDGPARIVGFGVDHLFATLRGSLPLARQA